MRHVWALTPKVSDHSWHLRDATVKAPWMAGASLVLHVFNFAPPCLVCVFYSYSAGSSGAASSFNTTMHDVWKNQPSPGVLTKVAGLFPGRFECAQLAACLKLSRTFVEQVEKSEVLDIRMLALRVLHHWLAVTGNNATCDVLRHALLDMWRKDMADALEDILAEQSQ